MGLVSLYALACLLIELVGCATFVMCKVFFEAILNIKERISQGLFSSLGNDVKRVNDSQYIGFHARLGKPKADGSRLISYYYFYRVGGRNGKQVNYFIGNSEQMDAGVARRIAMKIEPHVKAGEDLLKLKFEAEKKHVRLKDFWSFCGKDFFVRKYKNSRDAIRNIEADVLPQLGSVTLDKLSQHLIELRVFSPLIKRSKVSQMKVVASQFKVLLQHAVENDYLASQPIRQTSFNTTKPNNRTKPALAELTLSPAQIKGIYYRAAKSDKNNAYLYTLRIQILSGQSLSTILASYRQDIKGNYWSLRGTNGKLTGKVIPLQGPLKLLFKDVLTRFPTPESLFLFPSKSGRKDGEDGMDARAVAKSQQRFIANVHGETLSMSKLRKQIEQAMVNIGIDPLVVAYLFDRKVDGYLRLTPKDKAIEHGLNHWYNGKI